MTDGIAHRPVCCQDAAWGWRPADAKACVVTRRDRVQEMREGDIVVTRVGRHYSLGRLKADGHTQTPIESLNGRAAALSRACLLAGQGHRVFILEKSGTAAYGQFDCPKSSDSPT
jgi:hypothetical protein